VAPDHVDADVRVQEISHVENTLSRGWTGSGARSAIKSSENWVRLAHHTSHGCSMGSNTRALPTCLIYTSVPGNWTVLGSWTAWLSPC
jgi:dTDP-4-amino-4,6-dideoxygalactose transaminase